MKSEVLISLFRPDSVVEYEPGEPSGEKLIAWISAEREHTAALVSSLREQFASPLKGRTWCKSAVVSGSELVIIAGSPATIHIGRHGDVSLWVSRRAAGELLGALLRGAS
jgi:hypothetical protein